MKKLALAMAIVMLMVSVVQADGLTITDPLTEQQVLILKEYENNIGKEQKEVCKNNTFGLYIMYLALVGAFIYTNHNR